MIAYGMACLSDMVVCAKPIANVRAWPKNQDGLDFRGLLAPPVSKREAGQFGGDFSQLTSKDPHFLSACGCALFAYYYYFLFSNAFMLSAETLACSDHRGWNALHLGVASLPEVIVGAALISILAKLTAVVELREALYEREPSGTMAAWMPRLAR
jgi:hypothetical protein